MLWKSMLTLILFGLATLVSTALIAPSTSAASGRLVIELSKVGVMVRGCWRQAGQRPSSWPAKQSHRAAIRSHDKTVFEEHSSIHPPKKRAHSKPQDLDCWRVNNNKIFLTFYCVLSIFFRAICVRSLNICDTNEHSI
jgi:hypothetical protein